MLIKTPRQFSILAAFMLSLLSVVIVELTLYLSGVIINQRYILIMFFVLLLLVYWVIYYLLEKLITQKISLLYRTIHNFKINRGDFWALWARLGCMTRHLSWIPEQNSSWKKTFSGRKRPGEGHRARGPDLAEMRLRAGCRRSNYQEITSRTKPLGLVSLMLLIFEGILLQVTGSLDGKIIFIINQ